MRQKALLLALQIIVLLTSSPAFADVLCAPKNLKVSKRGTISFASKLFVAATCPKNSEQIVDLASLQGPKGEPGDKGAPGSKGEPGQQGAKGDTGEKGMPGFSYSTCSKKSVVANYTITNSTRQVPAISGACDSGKHLIRMDLTNTSVYSADWSVDMNPSDGVPPDTYGAGTTTSSTSRNFEDNGLWTLDEDGVFIVGISRNSSPDAYDETTALTGSEQRTEEYILICCDLG